MASYSLSGTTLDFATLSGLIETKQNLELADALIANMQPAPVDFAAGVQEMSRAYLEAHVISYGAETEERTIRLALLLLVHSLLTGSGPIPVQKATLQRLLAYYNREVFPIVLHAGPDISRLAQLCQPLLLSGKVRFQGYPLKSADVSEMFSWSALALPPAELQALLAAPVFTWAQAADVFINLKPLVNWFIYFDAVFARLLPESNTNLHRALKELVQRLSEGQQALEQEINKQAGSASLSATLTSLQQALQQSLQQLEPLNRLLLEGLETMVEPPMTSTFALAAKTTQRIALQASRPLPPAPEEFSAQLCLEELKLLTELAQTTAALIFWSFVQADVISGDFLESSTLEAYKQADLFVSEETVNEQLEKISNFIQMHFPVSGA